MRILRGQFRDAASGYQDHTVELAFDRQRSQLGGGAPEGTTPFSVRAIANDSGHFLLELPDDIDPVGPIRLAVFDPSGGRLLEETRDALPPAHQVLQLNVQPGVPFELGTHPDPFVDAPTLFSGHLVERDGRRTVGERQVILFGKRKLSDTGGADPIETALGVALSTRTGYFSMPYPRLFLASARTEVSGNVDPTGMALTLSSDGKLPGGIRLLVEIPEDAPTTDKPPDVPRALNRST